MTEVSVYEQDCHGKRQFRVMCDDGQLVLDRHMTDFDSDAEARSAIIGDFRRNKRGPVTILFHPFCEPGASRGAPRAEVHNQSTTTGAH